MPFGALADPVRLAIVERLAAGDLGAGEIAAAFPISRPAVSRHLRLLRESGLVRSRVAGQERVYALDRRPLAEIDEWLQRFRTQPGALRWGTSGPAGRLDALDTEMHRGRRRGRDDDRGEHDGRTTG